MSKTKHEFFISVLGRTIELLGGQMYKRREYAVAELIANCWDSGAKNVTITVPTEEEYDMATSEIMIQDDGCGMSPEDVQKNYLVIGRNKRESGEEVDERPPMGRKGIGKLACFGIASHMKVTTWREGSAVRFGLDANVLKAGDGDVQKVRIGGEEIETPEDSESGTAIVISGLKHKTPIEIERLRQALARIFSRKVKDKMQILLNGEPIGEPAFDFEFRYPEKGLAEAKLADGSTVRYFYGYSSKVIKESDLRGFMVQVRGKTAQAAPFFFNVETTASGQHATRYLAGAVEADFLDEGNDSASDIVSTDRQEIDWKSEHAQALYEWGQQLTRDALRDCVEKKGQKFYDWLLTQPDVCARLDALDEPSSKQAASLLKVLGRQEPEAERGTELADGLLKAFEYRAFHDVIGELEAASDDPAQLQGLLDLLKEWQILESRAVLEVVKGRIAIIEKFRKMIANDVPETAPKIGADNMHDLIAGHPWILNPDWQVLSEEKSLTKQLREWNVADIGVDDGSRYDFLVLTDERRTVIVEIKRSGHVVTLDDLQRLDRYKDKLALAGDREIVAVMVCGGPIDIKSAETKEAYEKRDDMKITTWGIICDKVEAHYAHYRAILEGNVEHRDFDERAREVVQTRRVLEIGSVYRGPAARAAGIGPQITGPDPSMLRPSKTETPEAAKEVAG